MKRNISWKLKAIVLVSLLFAALVEAVAEVVVEAAVQVPRWEQYDQI